MYGGDMVAAGQVTPDFVGYNELPWKFTAGTPNILGTIVSAQALRLLVDLVLNPDEPKRFGRNVPLERADVKAAMDRVTHYLRQLTERALVALMRVPGLKIYGPLDARCRTALAAFNINGRDPMELAESLSVMGVESRAGCHCATLAHHALGLNPPASCRLSFYFYNTLDEVDLATSAVAEVARSPIVSRPFVPPMTFPWVADTTPAVPSYSM
jgi:cysteine desulfurase/selenocysteine lyase